MTSILPDVKCQSLKDLVKETVDEVAKMEPLLGAEKNSRECAIIELKTEDSMNKVTEDH
jgi:hypothetical protein